MTSINFDGFILSQIPFLLGIITAAFPMIAVNLAENKPPKERTRWYIQGFLWILIGVGATVMYYSMDYGLDEPWDTVAVVSFLTTAIAFLAAFVVFISILIYRHKHPEKYKKNPIQPVIVVGPIDLESDDPGNPTLAAETEPQVEQSESKSVEHPEQPEPRLEDQPENAS